MGGATRPIITVVAAVAVLYAAPIVGEAILGLLPEGAAAGASAEAVGAAALSGSTSAVNAAVEGGNLEDVLKAGAISTAASVVGGEVASQVPVGEPVARGAVGGATGGATGAALRGRDPITGAIVGGVAGGVAGGIRGAFADPNIGDVEAQPGGFYGEAGVNEPFINPELQRFLTESAARTGAQLAGEYTARKLAGTPPTRERPTREAAATTQRAGGPTTYQVGDAPTAGMPGSQALGQALRVGSGDAGPGEPVESPGSGKTPERPVWNIASLRVKDETGGD